MKGLKRIWRILKLVFIVMKNTRNAPKHFAKVESLTEALLNENLGSLGERDLVNKTSEIRNTFGKYWPVFLSYGVKSVLVKIQIFDLRLVFQEIGRRLAGDWTFLWRSGRM